MPKAKADDKYTAAQKEALRRACENAYLAVVAAEPSLARRGVYARQGSGYSVPEPTIRAIVRQGGAEEARGGTPNWMYTYFPLTKEGIAVGLAEFKLREKKDLLKVAAERRAARNEKKAREKKLREAVCKPFRGINVRVGEGKKRKSRDLGVHIEKALESDGAVKMPTDLIEQLGKRIDALRESTPSKS